MASNFFQSTSKNTSLEFFDEWYYNLFLGHLLSQLEESVKLRKFVSIILAASIACFAFAQEDDVTEIIDNDMVAVEGGSFLMGSRDNENNETPVHEVTLYDFYILATEVTQAEYKAVIGSNFAHFKGDERPMEEVSWYDAIIFCNKLSIMSGLTPAYSLDGETDPDKWGDIPRIDAEKEDKDRWNAIEWDQAADGYRLPTEAEWEYAARGGASANETLYSGSNVIVDVAWNADTAEGATHEVALKTPNALGLFDMSGNVWEWCWDWYGNYHISDNENPTGADAELTGRKMRRGGSINSDAVFCRNANRASSVPELRGVDLGFRVVRSIFDDDTSSKPTVSASVLPVLEDEDLGEVEEDIF